MHSVCIYTFIIQLIFLQQYFPIPVPCNITQYCTGVIAQALGLRDILATMMCFNQVCHNTISGLFAHTNVGLNGQVLVPNLVDLVSL